MLKVELPGNRKKRKAKDEVYEYDDRRHAGVWHEGGHAGVWHHRSRT